jgi:hypothetical protein
MSKDRSARIVAFGIVLAIVGMIFAASYARADTFDERFSSGVLTPAPETLTPTPKSDEQWSIKLLLIIDGKIARSVTYNDETFTSGDTCRNAVLANTKLQASAQEAATEAAKTFGATAVVGIACAMELN